MTNSKPNKDEKQAELQKYRDLVLATLDYYTDNKEMQIKTYPPEQVHILGD